jgi:hypothetical protein
MLKLTSTKIKSQAETDLIAKAVARESTRKSILDQKIQLYITPEGEACIDFCVPIWMVFRTLAAAASDDPKLKENFYEVRIIRIAISALDEMITDNSYRRENITTLDLALDCAHTLIAKTDPVLFNQEWNKIADGM